MPCTEKKCASHTTLIAAARCWALVPAVPLVLCDLHSSPRCNAASQHEHALKHSAPILSPFSVSAAAGTASTASAHRPTHGCRAPHAALRCRGGGGWGPRQPASTAIGRSAWRCGAPTCAGQGSHWRAGQRVHHRSAPLPTPPSHRAARHAPAPCGSHRHPDVVQLHVSARGPLAAGHAPRRRVQRTDTAPRSAQRSFGAPRHTGVTRARRSSKQPRQRAPARRPAAAQH